jgi:hypothetical protein
MKTWLRSLFTRQDDYRQAQQLALRAEASVRKLSNLPPEYLDGAPDDIISVLKTTCLLLERLVNRLEAPPADAQNGDSYKQQVAQQETPLDEAATSPPSPATSEPEPSATVRELIKLRDWVLLAQTGGAEGAPQLLDGLYRGLGKVLEKEGVTLIEEVGAYDGKRQQVVDARPTDDPAQDNFVCATVRPGYLFHERLIRPQEVVVYTFDGSPLPATSP